MKDAAYSVKAFLYCMVGSGLWLRFVVLKTKKRKEIMAQNYVQTLECKEIEDFEKMLKPANREK